MADDDLKKQFDRLVKQNEDEIARRKKVEAEEREREDKRDKNAAAAQKSVEKGVVKQLQKNKDFAKAVESGNVSSIQKILDVELKKLRKNSKNSIDKLDAIAGITKEQQMGFAARATAEKKQNQKENSLRLRTLRLLTNRDEERRLTETERQRELQLWRDQIADGITSIKKNVKGMRSKLADAVKVIADPKKLAAVILAGGAGLLAGAAGGAFKFATARRLGLGIRPGQLTTTPTLARLFGRRGAGAGAADARFFGPGAAERAAAAAQRGRPAGRMARLAATLRGAGGLAGGEAMAGIASFFARTSARIQSIPGLMPIFRAGRGIGSVVGRYAAPVLAVVEGFLGFSREFKETGDVQKAIGEALTMGLGKVFTFGLIEKKELREKIKEPFLDITQGATEIIDSVRKEGFKALLDPKNVERLKRTKDGISKLVAAPFDLAFKTGTELVEKTSRFFGAEEFADAVERTFKDFNIGKFAIATQEAVTKGWLSTIERIIKDPKGTFKAAQGSLEAISKDMSLSIQSWIADINPFLDEDEKAKVKKQLAIQAGRFVPTFDEAVGLEEEAKIRATGFDVDQLETIMVALVNRMVAIDTSLENFKLTKEERLGLREDKDRLSRQVTLLSNQIKKQATPEAEKIPTAAAGAIVGKPKIVSVSEMVPEAIIPISRISDLIVNPSIEAALQMAARLSQNEALRLRTAQPVITPVTAPTIVTGGTGSPLPLVVPLATRNNENTLRQIMHKDFRGAMP